MDGESIDIKQAKLQRLKEVLPEAFVENQLDWEKLKTAFGDDINFANERYVLNWAGKSDAFRVLQQPTTATLKPVTEESYLTPGPSPEREGSNSWNDFINSPMQNLFIEGENLEVLKVLQKAYYGKIKCIIIDPPYNTGSDSFIYPDRFSEKKEDYLKRIGDKDEEGFLMKEGLFRKNSKDSGHYHSNWLSMMYPRLFLAKNLLRDDGVIFVHIDDNEVHNLRMVMNEIFGEENFVAQIPWKGKGGGADNKYLMVAHEYILFYSKSKDNFIVGEQIKANEIFPKYDEKKQRRYKTQLARKWGSNSKRTDRPNLFYPVKSPEKTEVYPILPNGEDGCWRWSKQRMGNEITDGNIEFTKEDDTWLVYEKIYEPLEGEFNTKKYSTWFDEYGNTANGTKEIIEIFERKLFDFPKPTSLTKEIIKISNSKNHDIILDFFGGSGTTAQAVIELNKEDGGNRKFILVQLHEKCDENSEAYKAGYKTIADIAKERIRRVIKKIEEENPPHPNPLPQGERGLFPMAGDTPLIPPPLTGGGEGEGGSKHAAGFKVFKLSPSSFKIWRGAEIDSEEKLVQQLDAFTNPSKPGAEKANMLYELMLKAGYELTSSVQYVIASGAKQSQKGNKIASGSTNPRNDSIGFYSINNNELIIALDAMNGKLIEQIIAAKPQKVITLDSLFADNDQLKTNTVLQMRDAGVDFKTI
ncbi:MAG: site-specific DNA-methyltransferase [Nitrospirota bacterium]